jgi:hypothetical protein
MGIASNTNYSAAVDPADIGQPTKVVPPDLPNGFKPTAPVAAEHVNYCLSRLEVNRETFTANDTWTKPVGAVAVRMILVGGGAGGGSGGASTGGVGGNSGEIVQVDFSATALPATLDVVVGAGGGSGNLSGGATYVASAGVTRAFALGGGGFADPGTPPDLNNNAYVIDYNAGGAGGSSGGGSYGKASRAGLSGAGGTAGNRGATGFGYGAGGGGGRNSSGTSAGGGGGGGGYGITQPAGAGGGTSTSGAAGAQGICIIFTWREIA